MQRRNFLGAGSVILAAGALLPGLAGAQDGSMPSASAHKAMKKASGSGYTHATAPTLYVEANGARFAYRRFGKKQGVPLVFNQHFIGNIDDWDPAVTDGLAQTREVILYDYRGVGNSSGEVPTTFREMGQDAEAFIDALGLKTVDLLGFSMGGMVAQTVTLERPELVRRLLLVGTGPRNGDSMETLTPESKSIFGAKYDPPENLWLSVLFTPSEASQAAGRAFLKRSLARTIDRDVPVDEKKVAPAQIAAVEEWGKAMGDRFAYLKSIKQPTLVVNGTQDIIIYTVNSWLLAQNLPNAELILYPDANHGSLFQYPERFVQDTNRFLNG